MHVSSVSERLCAHLPHFGRGGVVTQLSVSPRRRGVPKAVSEMNDCRSIDSCSLPLRHLLLLLLPSQYPHVSSLRRHFLPWLSSTSPLFVSVLYPSPFPCLSLPVLPNPHPHLSEELTPATLKGLFAVMGLVFGLILHGSKGCSDSYLLIKASIPEHPEPCC